MDILVFLHVLIPCNILHLCNLRASPDCIKKQYYTTGILLIFNFHIIILKGRLGFLMDGSMVGAETHGITPGTFLRPGFIAQKTSFSVHLSPSLFCSGESEPL